MARYIITDSSYYQPFSYDELVKPIQQMTDAHNAAADAYDQLSLETEALRNYISENEDDKQAKAMYDNYINKLHTLQDNLWNRGYNTGTRRDLSAARAAYASDITRLKTAVQTRQERSKEYWDARHKNPDLVAGFDPGTGGLDNYLADPEYGRNWYSYSGNQFASEVAAEAKARGAELVSTYATQNPALAGYLEYHVKNGFTNAQVNGATLLAQQAMAGQADLTDPNLDPVEALLASTLISRLQSTGAQPGQNLSSEEFGRLFNYGVLGLAQGIGSEDVKPINNKAWDEAMARGRIAYQQSLKNQAAAALAGQNGVHRELISRPIESRDADKKVSQISKWYDDETYKNGPITVNLPGGGSRQISNAEEARDLFRSDRIDKFYEATGIDLRSYNSDFLRTTDSKKTGEYKGVPIMVQEAGIGPFGRRTLVVKKKIGNKWVRANDLTDMANRAKNDYNTRMDQLGAANPRLNINSLGMSPNEMQKARKEEDVPDGVPDYDLRYALESKAQVGNYYGVPIAVGPEDADLKERFANTIMGRYANTHGKRDWKSSVNGFYRVGKGNSGTEKTNAAMEKAGGLGNVFGLDSHGNIDPNSIYSVYVMPQDIKDGKVNVRLETSKGTFMTDISTLGDDLNGAMNEYVSAAIQAMLLPLSQTVAVLDRNDSTGEGWGKMMANMLYGYGVPAVANGQGGYRPAEAAEVIRNPRLKQELLNAVTSYMLDAVSFGIDPISLRPRQHKSYTSAKAAGLYGYDDEE